MINTIILGHALNVLPKLPAESVNCCICSPPYWGLRDYGIEPVIWDGDKECEHEWGLPVTGAGKNNDKTAGKIQRGSKGSIGRDDRPDSNFCLKCNAWRGSLGLEPTFELYIKHLCDIFDEVKRVLRKDGTCWVNLGDSYSGSGGAGGDYNKGGLREGQPKYKQSKIIFPSKSLCLIPQRFAMEMVNRGWILRNTIIWKKPNCMPSSAKDRFTVDFEYIYFFVKNKKYWFEQQFEEHITQENRPDGIVKNRLFNYDSKLNKLRGYKTKQIEEEIQGPQYHGKEINYGKQGRNKRAVWTIPTQPFPEAHFAVYPEGLIEIPIKAGCPEFICKKCGKARVEIIKSKFTAHDGKINSKYDPKVKDGGAGRLALLRQAARERGKEYHQELEFLGYTDCNCNIGFEGGIVLDPFMGAGTTALVALKQRKRFIGIEIKQEYIDMAYKRIAKVQQEIF